MSFKREGNDPGLLKNLQHKRVSEILGDFIPDDEALLLSNGRLTCTICPKRPIFDTIQMLSLHRKGKNHLYELSCYLQQKRDSEYLRCRQMRKQFFRTGRLSAPSIESKFSSSPSPLALIAKSLTQPKKGKFARGRKFVLDTSESCKIKVNINAPVIIEKSANSQVRHYLKSLSKKRSIEKTVEEKRSSYPECNTAEVKSENRRRHCQSDGTGGGGGSSSSSSSISISSSSRVSESQLKMLESGWLRNSDGKWVKDPNVEFDSDEGSPE